MTIPSSQVYPNMPSNQRGAVLIVVLLFLILIMLVGVIAVRNSTTDLKLATSDQINTVLLQSSDSANNKIEQSVNGEPTSEQYTQIMGITGIFGHYLINEGSEEDIIDFCYRPREGFFNIDNAFVRYKGQDPLSDSEGFCDPTDSADYTSARNTTMTQVMVKNVSKSASIGDWTQMVLGSDSESKTAKMNTFDLYATSVIPAYGSADEDEIQECFKKDASAANSSADSVVNCMTDNHIPNKMLVEQVNVANIQNAEFCHVFGDTPTTAGSTSQLCRDS